MNLINKPPYVQALLRLISPVTALMPKQLLSLRMRVATGNFIHWKHPADILEYLFVKYFDAISTPEGLQRYANLADKVAVRQIVEERIGSDALARLYGTWENPNDIDFDSLPVPCVIKTNNGCGTNIFIRKRSDINPAAIRAQLKAWLKYPYGAISGQPHYGAIRPLVLAEELLEESADAETLPADYKIHCFGGEPRIVLVCSQRKVNGHITANVALGPDWKPIAGAAKHAATSIPPKPESLDRMLDMARKMAKGLDVVRVDFYNIGGRPVFGEMTLTPGMWDHFTDEYLRNALSMVEPISSNKR